MIGRTLALVGLTAALLGSASTAAAAEQEGPLVYQRRDTRQATWEATLAASELPVFGPWHRVGPFAPILRRPTPPEEDPRLDAQYPLAGKPQQGAWQRLDELADGYEHRLEGVPTQEKAVSRLPTVCLMRVIRAARPGTLRVFFGSDHQFIVQLNGRPVLYAGSISGFEPGQEVAELPLVEGDNVLVLKTEIDSEGSRFFFLPDFGQPRTEDLLAKLDRDFPLTAPRAAGYRQRARFASGAAEDRFYRIVEIEPPPGVVIEGGGLDFLPDGRLVVSTRRGFVYVVENPGHDDPQAIHFTRFASGLHDLLGLAVIDGEIVVVNRGEITRLLDLDGDGQCDRQECLANDWGLTGNYHEYAYGLPADAQGNRYLALNLAFGDGVANDNRWRGCVLRLTTDGRLEPIACGLRSPNGLGANLAGDVFVTDNQGDWVPASPLYHVMPGRYFGHPKSAPSYPLLVGVAPDAPLPERHPAAVWLPYEELCQSATEVRCDTTGGKFGPFAGQMFVGEMTKGLIARVALEQVDGMYQGACFLFRRGLGAVNRLAFGPDGKLYFARVNRGWGGGGLGDGLARLEFTGLVPMEIHRVTIQPDGFTLHFTHPLAEPDPRPEQFSLEQYTYNNWATYGSPRIEQEKLRASRVEVASDRRSLRLRIDGLTAGKVCQISLHDIAAADGQPLLHADAFYTINRLPAGDSR